MSLKINVHSLSIQPQGKMEFDYRDYAERHQEPPQPFVEVEYVDEEEGFVGLYPGIADPYGVRVDRTTAASLLRVCRFVHENKERSHKIEYALNGASITITNESSIEDYVELVVHVKEQFIWSADMVFDALRLIGEGLEYALEQFEASLVGRDASETSEAARRLLLSRSKPQMVQREPLLPQLAPASSSSSQDDDWGSESLGSFPK